jgi:hypothetical protein
VALADDAKHLRDEYMKVTRLQYEAQAQLHEFNAKCLRMSARHLVPPGHAIDYLGDGTIKRAEDCATQAKE